MNILMVLSQLEVTGAEVYSVSIAEKLIERGHKVFIISDTLTKKTKAHFISAPITKRTLIFRIKNSIFLFRFIKQNNIHIVNAHSRASAWVSRIACMLANVPLIVFIHGRQATFLSRRIFHGFGDYTITICEKLQEQLLNVFKVSPNKIEVLRNGLDLPQNKEDVQSSDKIISFITRLSGPKGDLAFDLLEYLTEKTKFIAELGNIKFRVIGGPHVTERFNKFRKHFEFTGYVEGLEKYINESSVVIGSGRIAIDSILYNKPTIAMGEACTIGLVTKENLDFTLATNFGDMNVTEKEFAFEKIYIDIKHALNLRECDSKVYERIKHDCDIEEIVDRLEYVFQSVRVRYYKNEIPIIYYHRVIENLDEIGKHGIYVTEEQFEKHLRYLKNAGYKTVSLEESLELKKNCTAGKFVIISFDDGYEDNYTLAFPLLKKYGFKAIIFLVAALEYNSWDEKSGEPMLKMMNQQQMKEMLEYGIEFGSHTLTHSDLSIINKESIEKELKESKLILQEKLRTEIKIIGYPYGNCNDTVKVAAQKAGYKFGFATDKAPLGLHEDFFQIRRIGIFPNTTALGLARKVKGNYTFKREKKISQFWRIPI